MATYPPIINGIIERVDVLVSAGAFVTIDVKPWDRTFDLRCVNPSTGEPINEWTVTAEGQTLLILAYRIHLRHSEGGVTTGTAVKWPT